MKLKESGIVTQELVPLKIFVETTSHTKTDESQEMEAHTEAEAA